MVSMSKGVTSPLVGNTGATIERLYVGVGWDLSGQGAKGLKGKLRRRVGVDLDVAAVAFDFDKNPVRMAWFDNLDPFNNGSMVLSGDNTTGKGDGDDESIVTVTRLLPAQIGTVVYIVTAFKEGVSFSKVEGVTCNLVDQSSGNVALGSFFPPIDATQSAIVLSKISRISEQADWTHTVLNELGQGRSKQAIINLARGHIS